MFAVVKIKGVQYKVQPSERVFVPRMAQEVGSTVKFDNVLLLADEKTVKVGTPTIKGLSVEAKVLGHVKDDKVIVFKKKRRKQYRRTHGHRQPFTSVAIEKIEGTL